MKEKLRIGSTQYCDVLVIGAGGAGLRCAAEVFQRKPGARVLAVTKVAHPQKSHTTTAQGGLAAVDPKDPIDKPIYHMFDTWKGSDCMADQNIVRKIIDAAWEEIIWLENRGMHFSRDVDGKLSKRTFGGHTVNFGEASAFRAVYEADRTGKGIIDTLWGEALRGGIVFLNQCMATELLFSKGRCVGAVIFRQKEGEFVAVLAKATVLGMGGMRASLQGHDQLPPEHRRLPRPRPRGGAARDGPGGGPISSDGDRRARHPGERDAALGRRDPAQQRPGTLHGALCPQDERPGAAGPRVQGDRDRDPGGPGDHEPGP